MHLDYLRPPTKGLVSRNPIKPTFWGPNLFFEHLEIFFLFLEYNE